MLNSESIAFWQVKTSRFLNIERVFSLKNITWLLMFSSKRTKEFQINSSQFSKHHLIHPLTYHDWFYFFWMRLSTIRRADCTKFESSIGNKLHVICSQKRSLRRGLFANKTFFCSMNELLEKRSALSDLRQLELYKRQTALYKCLAETTSTRNFSVFF